jgi:hypothetical protein
VILCGGPFALRERTVHAAHASHAERSLRIDRPPGDFTAIWTKWSEIILGLILVEFWVGLHPAQQVEVVPRQRLGEGSVRWLFAERAQE